MSTLQKITDEKHKDTELDSLSRKCKLKHNKTPCLLTRMLKLKRMAVQSVGKNMAQLEISQTVIESTTVILQKTF